MSKRTSFIITKHVKTPYVINTALPHKPRVIRYKEFKPGSMVTGVIKTKPDGKPDYVLVARTMVIPISCVRELVTQELTSNASGPKQVSDHVKKGNPKTKYADAGIIGAILGIGAVWLAEKKLWIAMPSPKNKLIGAAVGAGLFMYIVYRIRNEKKKN